MLPAETIFPKLLPSNSRICDAPQKLLLGAGVQLLHWPANIAADAMLNAQNHAILGAMVFYIVSIVVAAFLWANLEIQIEGEHGWAANLPTWKVEKHVLLDWFYGGRPLTGYHFWAFLSVFFFFHLPFFFTHTWSLRKELQAIAAYNLFWIVEDFLWFVLNPHFGWGKFSRGKIWWHKRWLLGVPLDYWLLGAIAVLLLVM